MNERHTIQKDLVYQALTSLKNHPTAEMVYETVCETHPNVSRATVYRILNQLAERGIILHIAVADGADRYDHQTHPHCHVICEHCRKVEDLTFFPEDLLKEANYLCDYDLSSYSLLFYGTCKECSGK